MSAEARIAALERQVTDLAESVEKLQRALWRMQLETSDDAVEVQKSAQRVLERIDQRERILAPYIPDAIRDAVFAEWSPEET